MHKRNSRTLSNAPVLLAKHAIQPNPHASFWSQRRYFFLATKSQSTRQIFFSNGGTTCAASKHPCYKAACKTKCILCTYQFIKLLVSIGEIIWGFVGNSAHLKTRGSEKPQNLCLVRSSQKTNQNQKNERIFTCSKLLLCLWSKENFQQVCDVCFFLYLWPSTRSSRHCFQQSTGRVK